MNHIPFGVSAGGGVIVPCHGVAGEGVGGGAEDFGEHLYVGCVHGAFVEEQVSPVAVAASVGCCAFECASGCVPPVLTVEVREVSVQFRGELTRGAVADLFPHGRHSTQMFSLENRLCV